MDKKSTGFLQEHSTRFLDMAFRSDRQEIVNNPDGYGKKSGNCNDTIELFLTVQKDKIISVSYHLNGCLNTNACANAIIVIVEGKRISQAWRVTPEMLIDYLQTLPVDHHHCAELVVDTLKLALSNVRDLQKDAWKRHYR